MISNSIQSNHDVRAHSVVLDRVPPPPTPPRHGRRRLRTRLASNRLLLFMTSRRNCDRALIRARSAERSLPLDLPIEFPLSHPSSAARLGCIRSISRRRDVILDGHL
ncbi:hypothetical protein EVAR_41358_1 [Eumeta japonica]|uniref:Uncharacterized protein n=1 Tax=Eumeta variegata TaxID=151549 RepID=A0A4C1XPH0_EUMVA|nr:hypothetical protein EVAR_41358_1 [Eumeta japonica]